MDTELARVQGVVIRTTPTTSQVQLMPSELVATVPAALLGELAKYGQPVDWVVRRRPDGTRYQIFEPRTVGENPVLPEIEDLLRVIEQHQREP
jgi:hypothetical protein